MPVLPGNSSMPGLKPTKMKQGLWIGQEGFIHLGLTLVPGGDEMVYNLLKKDPSLIK